MGTFSDIGKMGLLCLLAASPAASASVESSSFGQGTDRSGVHSGTGKPLLTSAVPYVVTRLVFAYAGPTPELRLNLTDKPFHIGQVSRLETAFSSLVFHPGSELRGQTLRALPTTLTKQPSTLGDLTGELDTIIADLAAGTPILPEETAYFVLDAQPFRLADALRARLGKGRGQAVSARIELVNGSCRHLVIRHRRTGRETAMAFLASAGRVLDAADPAVRPCLTRLFVRGLFGSEQQLHQQIGIDSRQLGPTQSCVLAELVPARSDFMQTARQPTTPCTSDRRYRAQIIKNVSTRAQLRR